ncbi:MAG: response regulator transcription factor [Chitinophagaceae bacterium]|nr:response regulator transcription factor [Chitinophagaceae bacterium]
MIKTVIIDDELDGCEVLSTLLERYCPQVAIVGVCNTPEEGLEVLADKTIQLVFLDIQMPRMNGFELLECLQPVNFGVIFTTSYDQFAIKAIRASALDYLLKPVDKEELQASVKKAEEQLHSSSTQQLSVLLSQLRSPGKTGHRIALPTMEGLQIIPAESIISCASSSNYTILSLKENQRIVVSRTLKEIEEMLEEYAFLRVHHSYLVNLNEIRKYIRGEGGSLVMSDGSSVDVSRSKKEFLLKRLQPGR